MSKVTNYGLIILTYSLLFNGIIHTNIHLFIHVILSLFFSLFFSFMVVRILSSKIYFLCFFLASFLIQMLRWIRGSSRVDFFIFLIAWGIFFGWWELDLQLLPSSLSSYELSFFFFPESTESHHFLLAHILHMNESHDLWRPFKVAITTSSFSTSSSTATFVLWFERPP